MTKYRVKIAPYASSHGIAAAVKIFKDKAIVFNGTMETSFAEELKEILERKGEEDERPKHKTTGAESH